MNNWLTSNPGKTVSIYEVAEFVNAAFSESFTISNICKSFEKTGIYPFNSNIFTDDDFLPSSITDRPDPTSQIQDNGSSPTLLSSKVDLTQKDNVSDQLSTSADLNLPSTSGMSKRNIIIKERQEELGIVSPEMLRPYPIASLRTKSKPGGRKKGKCSIITDTPEKDELMKTEEKRKILKRKFTKNKNVSKAAKKKCTSDSDTDTQISLHDESPPPQDLKEYLNQLEQEKNEETDSTCIVCGGEYLLSKEEFIQCRLCNKWAHESCGINGNLNFFCKKCF